MLVFVAYFLFLIFQPDFPLHGPFVFPFMIPTSDPVNHDLAVFPPPVPLFPCRGPFHNPSPPAFLPLVLILFSSCYSLFDFCFVQPILPPGFQDCFSLSSFSFPFFWKQGKTSSNFPKILPTTLPKTLPLLSLPPKIRNGCWTVFSLRVLLFFPRTSPCEEKLDPVFFFSPAHSDFSSPTLPQASLSAVFD